MISEDLELRMLVGHPIDINVGKLYSLKVKDIISMGHSVYNQFLGVLLYDVSEIPLTEQQLKDFGIDKFTTYDFLIIQSINDNTFRDLVLKSFECFFYEKVYFYCDEHYACFYLGNKDDKRYISKEVYELFRKILIKQNHLKELEEEENLVFGNERAKQMYLEMKKNEKSRPKPKPQVNLHSIISAVSWKSNKPKNEILNMTIYELYDGYHRLFLIDECSNLTQGIYHGTINGKEIKQDKLNWAKIINLNN